MEKCAFGGEMCLRVLGGVNSPKNCGCSGKVPTVPTLPFILSSHLYYHHTHCLSSSLDTF